MNVIEQSWRFRTPVDGIAICRSIENACRTCYQSHGKTTDYSYKALLKSAITKGHHSVLEHESISVQIITDRAVMAELTRHRLASFSCESQRYCNYKNGVTFVRPVFFDPDTMLYQLWQAGCSNAEIMYNNILAEGGRPEQARTVLNNSVAVNIAMTANTREWRHILTLRTSPAAYPQIRALCSDMLAGFKKEIPVLFDDIEG